MEDIKRLIEELMEAVKENYPGMTRLSILADSDGWANVDVTKWAESEQRVEDRPRKCLFNASRLEGGYWTPDRHEEQNEYEKRHGMLMEG